jgi:hypothetical protein
MLTIVNGRSSAAGNEDPTVTLHRYHAKFVGLGALDSVASESRIPSRAPGLHLRLGTTRLACRHLPNHCVNTRQ